MKTLTALQTHLRSMRSCTEAREWAGDRTAQEAWDETNRPEWLIWWRLKVHKNDRPALLLVIAPLLREYTLPLCRDKDRAVWARALDAAETWARDPNQKNSAAAAAASAAASAAYAAAASAAAYTAAAASAAAYAAAYAAEAATASAAAYAAAYAAEAAAASAAAYAAAYAAATYDAASSAAAYAAAGSSAAAYAESVQRARLKARAKLQSLWCTAIRARWTEAPILEQAQK